MSKPSKKALNGAANSSEPEAPAAAAPPLAPRVRRTDAFLHPSTALECAISRALDQELEWFFVYGEVALSRENVEFLPSYAAAKVFSSRPTEDSVRGKALELAQTVQGCLRALADRHASVLRAVYTPRRWPKNVEAEFQALTSVVVRLVVAGDPWPARSAHAGLEDAAAARLAARLIAARPVPVERMKAHAARLFGDAIAAYAKGRALESPAVGTA